MIAAGTENASPYQNILTTNTIPVSGTAETGATTLGATLFPNPLQTPVATTIMPTPWNVNPNAVVLPLIFYPSSETYNFTFTNYNSSNVTFPTNPQDMALSDTTDFSIPLGTDGCAGQVVDAPYTNSSGVTTVHSCTITLKYAPDGGVYNTRITAMGTIDAAGTPDGIVPLAFAGAMAPIPGALSVAPTVDYSSITYQSSCPTFGCEVNYAQVVEIVNSGTASLPVPSYSIQSTGTGSFSVVLTGTVTDAPSTSLPATCSAAIPAGKQCNAIIVDSPTGPVGSTDTATITWTDPGGVTATTLVSVYNASQPSGGAVAPIVPITVKGTEQSTTTTVPATAATASLTIQPMLTSVVSAASSTGGPAPATSGPAPSNGTPKLSLAVKVGSFQTTVQTPAGSTAATIAQAVAKALTVLGSPVKATASGAVVTMTSYTKGSAANVALSVAGNADFKVSASGSALTGGKNATTTTKYDTGLVNLTTNGVTAFAQWGKGATAATVATALAASVNKVASAYWSATASGDVVTLTGVSASPSGTGKSPVSLTTSVKSSVSKTAAAASSSPISLTVSDTAGFTPASFNAATN